MAEKDYCIDCKEAGMCGYAYGVNFCDNCKDRFDCDIRYYNSCPEGHDMECNNGFASINDYDDYDDEEDDE